MVVLGRWCWPGGCERERCLWLQQKLFCLGAWIAWPWGELGPHAELEGIVLESLKSVTGQGRVWGVVFAYLKGF